MTADGYVTDEAQLLHEIRDLLYEIRDLLAGPELHELRSQWQPPSAMSPQLLGDQRASS